jgi:hypothetical protein
MDEQPLEAQGVALGAVALGARRKVFRTFEVVRRNVDIDHPIASSHWYRHRLVGRHRPYVRIC